MPAPQTEQENCVAHNGSIVPVPGRDIMVQGWYQGGVSVFDFTDSAKPVEIAYFDRGPVDAKRLITAGQWSSYWYNGHIYGAEIARGLDVFRLTPSDRLSQNEIDAASQIRQTTFNAQQQPRLSWPAHASVGRAYLDQLTRTKGIAAERAAAVKGAIGRQNETLAAQLEQDAASAAPQDSLRLKSLAAVLRGAPVTGAQTATTTVEPGFTSLFNGTDLTGWKISGPAESFTVKDGAIVAQGAASHAYYDGEFRNHSFRNFELKVDVMTRAGSNGGIYVLTEVDTRRFPSKGFEIQVNNSHTDWRRTGSNYLVQDVREVPAQDGEWFTERIVVSGNRIRTYVNGKQLTDWEQPAGWEAPGGMTGRFIQAEGGTIGFQSHDPKSKVAYKNIRIKILD
jgi:hypothetical protein